MGTPPLRPIAPHWGGSLDPDAAIPGIPGAGMRPNTVNETVGKGGWDVPMGGLDLPPPRQFGGPLPNEWGFSNRTVALYWGGALLYGPPPYLLPPPD